MKEKMEMPSMNEVQLRTRVSDLLLLMGAGAYLRGFNYLSEAIIFALKHADKGVLITKDIYPSVADKHCVKPQNVERSIRHAIINIWNKGRMDEINRCLGINICRSNDRPTNGEFIALLAQRLLGEFYITPDGEPHCIKELYFKH